MAPRKDDNVEENETQTVKDEDGIVNPAADIEPTLEPTEIDPKTTNDTEVTLSEDETKDMNNAERNDGVAITKKTENVRQRENERSNYLHNITNSGLNLNGKENMKEAPLLFDSKTVVRFSPVWKQTLTATAAIVLTFTSGLTSGYSAILLPQLKNSDIPSDDSTASWIAAMAALPMAPGCLIGGWMMEKFGRRNSHYMTCGPFLLGWILIACADNLALILLGRFFTGLCVGLLGPLSPVYIGETTEPKYRGIFLAGVSLAIAVGILVAHILGTYLTWQWTAVICCIFPVLGVLLLSLVPESPTWLISKGQIEEGAKAFTWLRGYSEEAKAELKGIIDKRKAADNEPVPNFKERMMNLKSPELIKPLVIMIIFFITCQFSGVNAIAFYSIEIVEKAVGKGMDHYMAMLIIDLVRVVMSIVACVICKMYGRRPLCMISGVCTSLSMIGLSSYLYWTDGQPTNMSWLPLTCLTTYICAISIGLVPLPWMMCGEIFPTKTRGLGSGISSATTFAAFFIVVKTAPGLMANVGEVITFLIYGVVALVGTAILYFILPETKGKSLQEIEDKFKKSKISVA
ncbi:facilitated trehalose transporter Tret1-2 homolog [Epargyreus clarus]|uniref:facilitated trehalose transporter Tret1-2 homolog n=1 Tax=Epargyreus clarus TaxID=520877 RepID=UPI003C2F76C8